MNDLPQLLQIAVLINGPFLRIFYSSFLFDFCLALSRA